MGWMSVRDGGASSLAGCAVSAVRLQMSTMERLLLVLRWTLGLAGVVVVLWLGAPFLAASPANPDDGANATVEDASPSSPAKARMLADGSMAFDSPRGAITLDPPELNH